MRTEIHIETHEFTIIRYASKSSSALRCSVCNSDELVVAAGKVDPTVMAESELETPSTAIGGEPTSAVPK